MTAYTRNMPETATYWPPGQNDGFGGVTYGSPVTFPCRWQDKAELFRDSDGREVVSQSVVYVGTDQVSKPGKLARGEFTDVSPVASAQEVREVQESPALRGRPTLFKVML